MSGELGLEPRAGAERLHEGDVGEGLGGDGARGGEGGGRLGGKLLHEVTAEARQDQVRGEEGDEDAGEDGDAREGDDVGGDEEADLADQAADLLARAGLDGVEVVVEPGAHLAGVLVVEEAGLLPQQVPEVRLPQPVRQPLRHDVPADVVQVDQDELRRRDVGEPRHGEVDRVLELGCFAVGLDAAGGGVQVIQELPEEDAHQRVWDASSDGEHQAGPEEQEVEPCWLGAEQESEPTQKLPLCLRKKSVT